MNADEHKHDEVLAPPAALISENPLKWLRYFGPGAIVAAVTIGSGEILFPSRGGAIFGYSILWVFLFVAFLKWVMAYSSIRHMVLSGGHPLDRWSALPGPRNFIHIFILIMVLSTLPIAYAYLSGILGTICTWIFGIGDEYIWATAALVTAGLLLLKGDYPLLERAQTFIMAFKVGCILLALFFVPVDWSAVFRNLFVPHRVAYPDWVRQNMPQIMKRSVWLEVMTYVSLIGGASVDYLSYASFLRDKKWGRAHLGPGTPAQLEQIAAAPRHPARLWLRAALTDTALSFIMVVVISSAFCVLGAVVLRPQHLAPDGKDLLNYQVQFLTAIARWLEPLYKIGIFMAFFATVYGSPELNYRLIAEISRSTGLEKKPWDQRKLRIGIIALCLIGGIIVTWLRKLSQTMTLIDMFTPLSIVAGVVLSGVHCLLNPWVDWRFLPAGLRMPKWFVAVNLFAAVVFIIAGIKAFSDYRGYGYWLLAFIIVFSLAIILLRDWRSIRNQL